MCADDEWERLSPFGLPLNGLGSDENEGSLERRARKMCGELRPEVKTCVVTATSSQFDKPCSGAVVGC